MRAACLRAFAFGENAPTRRIEIHSINYLHAGRAVFPVKYRIGMILPGALPFLRALRASARTELPPFTEATK
jgi:hypothetical protein